METTIFEPHSPQAAEILRVVVQAFVICGLILSIVTGLVVYIMVRYRRRATDGTPRPVFGYKPIEVVWTTIPFLILVWLFYLTAHAMSVSDPPANREPDLVVTGHQWWWEARYKSGVVVANEIHLPIGTNWLVRLESVDVIHDFWVPHLARKIDAVPGHPNYIWLRSNIRGVFPGLCAEFCGAQHAWMRFSVVAEPPEDFARWEKEQSKEAAKPQSAAVAEQRGLQLFRDLTCISCHTIRGVGTSTNSTAGPDLTHLASRQMLAGNVIANTPQNLARWLKHPQQIKPASFMPDLHLTDAQVDDLTAYLVTLK